MQFQVSARKWRPQKFSELIGQEAIVRTLRNAIEMDRVAHAYVFSGTRGVGKTTSARLLAKALNCETGPTPDPCDACVHCVEIREGRSVDVLEIDGASNNSVAEVRGLVDQVQYATAACRFKVYIIDEVHMLSKSAFNALLKTLEEPPARVVFIFATTELSKIPETILSRCQCFEFKPLSHPQIVQQLQLICSKDGVEIDAASLEEIAKNGAGSMRDAQSLLDQVIAFCGKKIDPGSVEGVLGLVGSEALAAFVGRLQAKDGPGLLEAVHQLAQEGKDLPLFCRDLAEHVRDLMIVKLAADPAALLAGKGTPMEVLRQQAGAAPLDELQQMFQVLVRAEEDMKRSSLPRMVFEMAVVRLLDLRPYQALDALINQINALEAEPAPAGGGSTPPVTPPEGGRTPKERAAPAPAVGSRPAAAKKAASPKPAGGGEEPVESAPEPASADARWEKIRAEAIGAKKVFGHYLAKARLVTLTEDTLQLSVPDPFTHGQVGQEENIAVLREAVERVCGYSPVRVQVQYPPPPEGDPGASSSPSGRSPGRPEALPGEDLILKDALNIFGGSVIR